jgi:hypothetical protein
VSPNGGLKAAPSPPQQQNSEHTSKAERGELNGLVVYADVRIGLTLYGSSCDARYKLDLFFGKNKNGRKQNIVSRRHHIKGGDQRECVCRRTCDIACV